MRWLAMLLFCAGSALATGGDEWRQEGEKAVATAKAHAAPAPYRFIAETDRYFCRNSLGELGLNPYRRAAFGMTPRDFECMDLDGARISFKRENLHAVSFAGSRWRGVDVRFANFSLVDFRGADLRGMDFTQAMSMIRLDLRGADLRGTDLSRMSLEEMLGANWRGAVYDEKTRLPPAFVSEHSEPRDPHAMDRYLAEHWGMVKKDSAGEIVRPTNILLPAPTAKLESSANPEQLAKECEQKAARLALISNQPKDLILYHCLNKPEEFEQLYRSVVKD